MNHLLVGMALCSSSRAEAIAVQGSTSRETRDEQPITPKDSVSAIVQMTAVGDGPWKPKLDSTNVYAKLHGNSMLSKSRLQWGVVLSKTQKLSLSWDRGRNVYVSSAAVDDDCLRAERGCIPTRWHIDGLYIGQRWKHVQLQLGDFGVSFGEGLVFASHTKTSSRLLSHPEPTAVQRTGSRLRIRSSLRGALFTHQLRLQKKWNTHLALFFSAREHDLYQYHFRYLGGLGETVETSSIYVDEDAHRVFRYGTVTNGFRQILGGAHLSIAYRNVVSLSATAYQARRMWLLASEGQPHFTNHAPWRDDRLSGGVYGLHALWRLEDLRIVAEYARLFPFMPEGDAWVVGFDLKGVHRFLLRAYWVDYQTNFEHAYARTSSFARRLSRRRGQAERGFSIGIEHRGESAGEHKHCRLDGRTHGGGASVQGLWSGRLNFKALRFKCRWAIRIRKDQRLDALWSHGGTLVFGDGTEERTGVDRALEGAVIGLKWQGGLRAHRTHGSMGIRHPYGPNQSREGAANFTLRLSPTKGWRIDFKGRLLFRIKERVVRVMRLGLLSLQNEIAVSPKLSAQLLVEFENRRLNLNLERPRFLSEGGHSSFMAKIQWQI